MSLLKRVSDGLNIPREVNRADNTEIAQPKPNPEPPVTRNEYHKSLVRELRRYVSASGSPSSADYTQIR